MHFLIGAVLAIAGCGLWYVLGRQRFNRSNGLPAPRYRSFLHKVVATASDRVLSVVAWVCVLVGLVLLI